MNPPIHPCVSSALAVIAVALLWAAPSPSRAQILYIAGGDTVGEYDATTGAVINTPFIGGLDGPQGMALWGNNLYVSNYGTGTVGVYDATTGATINDSLITGLDRPGGLAVSGSNLYIMSGNDSTGTVGLYNAVTGAAINASFITGLTFLLAVPQDMVISGNNLYIAIYGASNGKGGYNGTVSVYDATTGAAINSSFITGIDGAEGLAISGNNLYVTNEAIGTVGEYNATTGAAINTSLVGGLSYPEGLAVSGSNLYVTNNPSGVVGVYNSTTGATVNATFINETGLLYVLAVTPVPPVISSALSSTGTNGLPFTYQIAASNNPTGFEATGLPPGLGVGTSTGIISGTPAATGTFAATISAINAGGTDSETFTVTILPAPPSITSALSATGTSGTAFNYQITASNTPASFDATGLPQGLSVNTSTGLISGIPEITGSLGIAGVVSVKITATNAGGSGSAILTLTILPLPPVITSALSVTGTSGVPFNFQITGSDSPTSFGASGLPPGVHFSASTGLISGIPAATGTFAATISAINIGGTDSETLSVTILPPVPVIIGSLMASGTNGSAFNYQITASSSPASYNATGLPAGLTVNTYTGLISGTPAASGTFAPTISATNAGGTGYGTLALAVYVDFSGLRGSYTGLGSMGGTNVGLFTLSLTPRGSFTGKLTLAGAHYSMKGVFSAFGTFGTAPGAGALGMALAVDPSGVSGTITTTTAGAANSYAVESGLLGKFNATTIPLNLAGNYTVIIPGLSGTGPALPNATGYGTMSVAATGAVSIIGKLGDGTAFSSKGKLHADGKTCTLFNTLYGGKNPGSIAGDITFEDSIGGDWDGVLDWIKPAQAAAVYYPGGFSASVNLLAAKFASPPLPLPLTSGTFTLAGGNLSAPVTDNLTVSSRGKATVGGTNSVTLTLNPGTGAFSGKFLYPVTDKKTSFGGVIYQKPAPATGYGLFLWPDPTGRTLHN